MTLSPSTMSGDVWGALRFAHFPALMVGRARVGPGEADWRRALAGRSFLPHESRAILARLGRRDLLVATPEGRARLRRWLNLRWARPMADPAEPVMARLHRVVDFYGDRTM